MSPRTAIYPATEQDDLLCPIRYTIDMFGGKWKLPILCQLADGNAVRYSSIKRRLPRVTNMMLSQSLKELEAAGIVHREQYNEIPPRVEYSLTEKGRSILPVLLRLAEWGMEHVRQDTSCDAYCDACRASA
jgi:Predicted transcriptional regulators